MKQGVAVGDALQGGCWVKIELTCFTTSAGPTSGTSSTSNMMPMAAGCSDTDARGVAPVKPLQCVSGHGAEVYENERCRSTRGVCRLDAGIGGDSHGRALSGIRRGGRRSARDGWASHFGHEGLFFDSKAIGDRNFFSPDGTIVASNHETPPRRSLPLLQPTTTRQHISELSHLGKPWQKRLCSITHGDDVSNEGGGATDCKSEQKSGFN